MCKGETDRSEEEKLEEFHNMTAQELEKAFGSWFDKEWPEPE